MHELLAPLDHLDWEDTSAVAGAALPLLETLAADGAQLGKAVDEAARRDELLSLCEHFSDSVDKLVLYDSPAGVRLRLHVFLPGYLDAPHNHRWTFATRILRGGYLHRTFGPVDLDTVADPAALSPLHAAQEGVGSSYALHHTMVHTLEARPGTVSLVLRGPAVKGHFSVVDPASGQIAERRGAATESARSARSKRMTAERLRQVSADLRRWGITS